MSTNAQGEKILTEEKDLKNFYNVWEDIKTHKSTNINRPNISFEDNENGKYFFHRIGDLAILLEGDKKVIRIGEFEFSSDSTLNEDGSNDISLNDLTEAEKLISNILNINQELVSETVEFEMLSEKVKNVLGETLSNIFFHLTTPIKKALNGRNPFSKDKKIDLNDIKLLNIIEIIISNIEPLIGNTNNDIRIIELLESINTKLNFLSKAITNGIESSNRINEIIKS